MQESTAQNLRAVAPKILSGEIKKDAPFTPEVVKRAIDILEVLRDGQWHTATEIAQSLDIGAKYARDVLRVCAEAWELESHRRNGWRSGLTFCPSCKSVYYVDDEGDHFYHECDRCGWHQLRKSNDVQIP
ncbi:hypothetical protein [Leptolyngbya ohadii]|uniref:hypothetical protein n=1 Tax=Leptolyngbya ohadii TaxID=1962290 RepID=UPI000B598EE1|nr:hypothetical protein [Leptolyngbya ohadii]